MPNGSFDVQEMQQQGTLGANWDVANDYESENAYYLGAVDTENNVWKQHNWESDTTHRLVRTDGDSDETER